MQELMKILLTGASGFVGRSLCDRLLAENHRIIAPVRSHDLLPYNHNLRPEKISGLQDSLDWKLMLKDVEVIIHLASRVHVMNDTSIDPLAEFRKINVGATLNLARQAVELGVQRFIYMSSIKVNGEKTLPVKPFTAEDKPAPVDPYGISKYEVEQSLAQIASETGLEVVILRPPLVYGPNVKANFLRLIKWVKLGLPLPLGSLHNQRSMVYVGNLVDAVIACLEHPSVAGETFLVSDGEDVSTPQLITMIASAMGKTSRVLPFPTAILNILGKATGKSTEVERLANSLCVDSGKIRTLLGWNPPFTMEAGIQETVNWYMNQR